MHPHESVEAFNTTYRRVLKAIGVLEPLKLSDPELNFFATASSFRVNSGSFLDALPIATQIAATDVATLFMVVMQLLKYAELKVALGVSDDTLTKILANPDAVGEDGTNLLTMILGTYQIPADASNSGTRLSGSLSPHDTLIYLGWTEGDPLALETLIRLNAAANAITTLGVPTSDALQWTTCDQSDDIAAAIQEALRAKYDESEWLTAIQPLNDTLRARQRDSLVSYIVPQLRKSPKTEAVDTADKLFEHLLVDVEISPCMQTSRIKQALSTVQLFIDRSLMNLEPDVPAAMIAADPFKADQLKWMKNYRVWEANRKIFCYPENWLDPELRDNKSSFFRDLESELLQADITEDLAQTALLHYLEKLEDVAKLEICGMCVQNAGDNKSNELVHIIGRTAGSSRKYYYRRLVKDVDWTPWEKIDLDIEDTPLLPVVWNNRLFLFWLTAIQKTSGGGPLANKQASDTDTATSLTVGNLASPVTKKIEVSLCWSEYFNNKWQIKKTSALDDPVVLDYDEAHDHGFTSEEGYDFKRENLQLASVVNDNLLIGIDYAGHRYGYFELASKQSAHSKPTEMSGVLPGRVFSAACMSGSEQDSAGSVFCISSADPDRPHLVLENCPSGWTDLEPEQNDIPDYFVAPFFYQDQQRVFYADVEQEVTSVAGYQRIGTYAPPQTVQVPPISKLYRVPVPGFGDPAKGVIPPPMVARSPAVDPVPADRLAHVEKVLSTDKLVNYDQAAIGAIGSQVRQS